MSELPAAAGEGPLPEDFDLSSTEVSTVGGSVDGLELPRVRIGFLASAGTGAVGAGIIELDLEP